MNKRAIPTPCATCGREKNDGRAECNSCRVRRYRQDPENLARDRERTALWKLEHRLAETQREDHHRMSYATEQAEGDYAEAMADTLGHNLVRMGPPSNGSRIHRAECRYAQKPNALPWNWAEGRPLSDWVFDHPWLKPCQVCRPDLPREN